MDTVTGGRGSQCRLSHMTCTVCGPGADSLCSRQSVNIQHCTVDYVSSLLLPINISYDQHHVTQAGEGLMGAPG